MQTATFIPFYLFLVLGIIFPSLHRKLQSLLSPKSTYSSRSFIFTGIKCQKQQRHQCHHYYCHYWQWLLLFLDVVVCLSAFFSFVYYFSLRGFLYSFYGVLLWLCNNPLGIIVRFLLRQGLFCHPFSFFLTEWKIIKSSFV